jgi:hypothetical protein
MSYCEIHKRDKVECFQKNCTGCWYLEICDHTSKMICSTCASLVNRKRAIRERAQTIIDTHKNIARKIMKEEGQRSASSRNYERMTRATEENSYWTNITFQEVVDDLMQQDGLA